MMPVNQLHRGRVEKLSNRKLNSIRVFISSTFTDTNEERDALIHSVYPKLNEYCQNTYRIQFKYSDMRWGVQEQAAYDHSTVNMCLFELDECYRYSLATNCVIFLSHRYGGRMLPVHMSKHVGDSILSVLTNAEQNFVKEYYRLDHNLYDPIYVLRPIDQDIKKSWKESQKRLEQYLRNASNLCFQAGTINENERNEFHVSVTAQEIYRSLKNNQNQYDRMIVFFREIEDIETFPEDMKSKFIDTKDEETKHLLEKLKGELKTAIISEHIRTYKVQWMNEVNRKRYIEQFQKDFFSMLKEQIDHHMKKIVPQSSLYEEILEHSIQCKALTERYCAREDIMHQVKTYLKTDRSQCACVIHGISGSGKSSIMAQILIEVPQWMENYESTSVVIRFLGTTPLSSDIRRPLISIIRQICSIYNIQANIVHENSCPLETLKSTLERIMHSIPKNEKLILLFDSVDQLQVQDYDVSKWLPSTYPENVKCILSTIPIIDENEVEYKILDNLKQVLYQPKIIEIIALDYEIAENMFQFWLDRDQRRLTSRQMEWIKPMFVPNSSYITPHPTPFFLSLIYDLTLSWHSYDDQPDPEFLKIKTSGSAIEYLFSQLSKKHGEMLFLRSMAYLRQSGGLTDLEMEDLLSADDEVLNSIFIHYLPPSNIFRLPSSLWIRIRNDMSKYLIERNIDNTTVTYFYHRKFRWGLTYGGDQAGEVERIRRAYFSGWIQKFPNLNEKPFVIKSKKLIERNQGNPNLSVNRCLNLQKPYTLKMNKNKIEFNLRRINQLRMHLSNLVCIPWFLYDFDFLSSYLNQYKLRELQASLWFYPELRFLLILCETASHILDNHPNNFAFELASILLPLADLLPEIIHNLLEKCLHHTKLCLVRDQYEAKNIFSKYHVDNAISIQLDQRSQNLFVFTPSIIYSFHLINVFLLDTLITYELPSDKFIHCSLGKNYACTWSSEKLLVLTLNTTKKSVQERSVENILHTNFLDDKFLLICSAKANCIEVWNCVQETTVTKHIFNVSILKCSSIRSKNEILVRVNLADHSLQYWSVKIQESSEETKIDLQQVTTIINSTYENSLFLNYEIDLCYNENDTSFYFYRPVENQHQLINRLTSMKKNFVIHHFQVQSSSSIDGCLIWLNEGFITILHSCGHHFSIPGYFDQLLDNPHRNGNDTIFCLNKNQSTVTLFEWKCDAHRHSYRELMSMSIPTNTKHCIYNMNDDCGITLYCSLDNGELQKYYVTMMNNINDTISSIERIKIDRFETHGKFLATLDITARNLRIFSMETNLLLIVNLEHVNEILQVALTSQYIVLIDSSDLLYVYTMDREPEIRYKTNKLKHSSTRLYSISNSVIVLDADSHEILHFNFNNSFDLQSITTINFNFSSLLNAMNPNRDVLFILSDDGEKLAFWKVNLNMVEYQMLKSHVNSPLIYSIQATNDALIFYDKFHQVYIRYYDNLNETHLLDHSDILQLNETYLVLLQQSKRMLITYDLKKKFRGSIKSKLTYDMIFILPQSQYLLAVSQQASTLVLYDINDGSIVQNIFIETPPRFIDAVRDHVFMICNENLIVMQLNPSIDKNHNKEIQASKKRCQLLEMDEWIDCYAEQEWIDATLQSLE